MQSSLNRKIQFHSKQKTQDPHLVELTHENRSTKSNGKSLAIPFKEKQMNISFFLQLETALKCPDRWNMHISPLELIFMKTVVKEKWYMTTVIKEIYKISNDPWILCPMYSGPQELSKLRTLASEPFSKLDDFNFKKCFHLTFSTRAPNITCRQCLWKIGR